MMARYDIYAFCDCGDVHPMRITVDLADGPAEKKSIGDTYHGKEVPQELIRLHNNSVQCPKTGNLFFQKDNNQLFLVPIESP